jgi:hypothetical protein
LNGKESVTYSQFLSQLPQAQLSRLYSTEENIIIDFEGNNYIFTDDDKLIDWARVTTNANVFILALDTIDQQQEYAISRNMLDDEESTEAYSDSTDKENEARGIPFISALYDLTNYGGNFHSFFLFSFRPTLGSFNNRASSLQDWNLTPRLNLLASKTWFRGRKLFYWSWTQISNLSTVNFDNDAESKL